MSRYLFVQVQKLGFYVLHCQMSYFWLISLFLPQGKESNTVTHHNGMALHNLLDLHFLIPFIKLWLPHYPSYPIVHCATYEHWLPVTLSKMVTLLHWLWSQIHVLSIVHRKVTTINHFSVMVNLPFRIL